MYARILSLLYLLSIFSSLLNKYSGWFMAETGFLRSTKRWALLPVFLLLVFNCVPARALPTEDAIAPPSGTSNAVLSKFNQGLELINSGKYMQAAEIYAGICKSSPEFAEAHMMYGVALMKMNKISEAEKELLKTNALKPDCAAGLVDLGSVYQMQGRYAEALAKFNRYLQLYPKGKHVSEVTGLVRALKTEQLRSRSAESSVGKDNYLSEATAGGAARWLTGDMPISVFISPGSAVKGYRDNFSEILKQAFDDWIASSQGKITLKYTDSATSASIICTWVDDPKQVMNPAEGGQALLAPSENGAMGRTRIKILTQNAGMTAEITEPGLRHVSLHEVGHALGLLGHSSQPGDIMFTTINYSCPLSGLSERDKDTLAKLYACPDSFFSEHKINIKENYAPASRTNPTSQAIQLNNQALQEVKLGHYLQAMKLFEQALKSDPESDFINLNIASCYSEIGISNFKAANYAGAEKNMLAAAEKFYKCGRKDMSAGAYNNLANIARMQKHVLDVQKYQAKADSMRQ